MPCDKLNLGNWFIYVIQFLAISVTAIYFILLHGAKYYVNLVGNHYIILLKSQKVVCSLFEKSYIILNQKEIYNFI